MVKFLQKITITFFLALSSFFFQVDSVGAEMSIAGVTIEPTVNVTYAYDDNYRFADQKESAYSVNVSPSVDLRYKEGIAEITLNVRNPYRYFSESTGKKSKFHETFFDSDMVLQLPARVKLRLGDEFVSTKLSPFLTEERFDRTERTENRFSSNLTFPIGTMFDFGLDYRNENYRFVDTQTSFFPFSINNRKLDNINFRFSIHPVEDTSVFVRYWYQRNLYENDPTRDSQSRQVNYGIEQSVGEFIRLMGQIGTGKRTANSVISPEEDRLTWAGSIFLNFSERFTLFYNVNKSVTSTSFDNISSENTRKTLSMFLSFRGKLTDNTDLDIIASKTNNTSNAVRGGDTIFKNITMRLENNFFDKIRSEIEYRYGINEFEGGGFFFSGGKQKDKRWSVEGSLSFILTRKTTFRVGYLHEDRSSFFGNFDRNRISFSINLKL